MRRRREHNPPLFVLETRWVSLRSPHATLAARPTASTTASHQLHRCIANDTKVDPANQVRTECFGSADGSFSLSQGTDIRPERYDSAKHQSNRSERGG